MKLKVKNLRKLGDIHKHEEIKQHTSKQPKCQRRNQYRKEENSLLNGNENIIYKNLWAASEIVLRETFLSLTVCTN